MKFLAALAAVALAGADAARFDYATAGRIAIQHNGRVKPLDSFAREILRDITGKEAFAGYRDPVTGAYVEVFGKAEPVAAVLRLAAEPEKFRSLRFIRVDHPKVKAELGLEADRVWFSIDDLAPHREAIAKRRRAIRDRDNATSAERAILALAGKESLARQIMEERLLTVVPIPAADAGGWITPVEAQRFLSGTMGDDPLAESIAHWIGSDGARRSNLERSVAASADMKRAIAQGDAAGFNRAAADLAAALKALGGGGYPADEDLDQEIWYHRLKPFSWATLMYFLGVLAFVGAYVFGARAPWGAGLALQAAGIAMTAYGYGLRWDVANRYPLSNHYESMIAVAFTASIIAFIAELVQRKRAFGLAGCTVAALMILLADTVPVFAQQSAISTIMPALQTFWMTIHVPVIMAGYAGGAIICVLGHIYVGVSAFGRSTPAKETRLQELDDVMYRALQVTVLFLLAGIVLGAVWAGEAWGRPWGWDMKETWALITLISYLATLHGRFTGFVKGMGTALAALGSFALLVLCYYGVNFLFGKGLHTYGFGAGDWVYLFGFFAGESVVAAVGVWAWASRRHPSPPELIRE